MMKKSLSKKLALLLAGAMAVGMFAGCGSDNTEDTSGDTANATDNEDSGDAESSGGGYTDYSGGFDETVTIQIPVYDRAFEGWDVTDNYYTKWVQSEFGEKYNVNVEYVAIGRTTEVQDYMQMIAAGTAPDIIMHYDMPQAVNYYNEGAMQNLDYDELAYYAPDFYEATKDAINTYGTLDGENAFLFAGRNAIYYNYVTLIRQDWLDQVNMEMPTTLDELEEAAKAWKDAGLGKIGDQLIDNSFTYFYGYLTDDQLSNEEELAQYLDLNVAPFTWEPTKEYLQRRNQEYNDGILDPEFYLNSTSDTDWKADFVAGNVGTYSFYISANTDVISALLANDPDAKLSVLPTTVTATGKGPYYEYPPYGMIMGINSKTSDEERAAVYMYLNWLIQPENLMKMQYGEEGKTYNLDENGVAVPVTGYTGEEALSQNSNKDYYCLVQEMGVDYGSEELNYQANLRTLAPEGYEYLVEESYNYNKETEADGIVTPVFTATVESSSEYATDLAAMWKEFYVDCITCAPDEFEALYEEYCQEYLDGGYQEILDEKAELYADGQYISGN